MRQIHLVTGGSRSGKSNYAVWLGEKLEAPRAFIATSGTYDNEMRSRIEKHRLNRSTEKWTTFEEKTNLVQVIRDCNDYPVILIDCLTLWVYNLMLESEKSKSPLREEFISRVCLDLVEAVQDQEGTLLMVSNEIGFGIIPDNSMSRLYRDLIGRCNQTISQKADQVTLMVSGIPLSLKGNELTSPRLPERVTK